MPSSSQPTAITNLLALVAESVAHHEQLAKLSGERFNLFQLLGVGYYEVSTHSAILSELLDPNGTHGCGAVFLQRFLEALNLQGLVDLSHVRIASEHYLGPKEADSGGRIDIMISDARGPRIAIENKIYANDQENWVVRYLKPLPPEGRLIYLTLEGDPPANSGTYQTQDLARVLCIGYASHIIPWLETCRKEAAMVPIVRESLSQYIHLIQRLTHQHTDHLMSQAIVSTIVSSKENFAAFRAIRDAEGKVRSRVILDFVKRITAKIPQGFKLAKVPDGKGGKEDGFLFSNPALEEANLFAVVSFDGADYRQCYFGFEVNSNSPHVRAGTSQWDLILRLFKDDFGECSSTGPVPAYQCWKDFENWENEILEQMAFDSDRFDQAFITQVQRLLNVSNLFADQWKSPLDSQPTH